MRKRDGEATRIGCPACAGVLSSFSEGRDDFVRYVCSVGHSFSFATLIEAKEDQFEHGMWAAISLLMHLEMVYTEALEQGRGAINADAAAIHARIRQVRQYAEQLRALVEHDQPPALDAGRPAEAT
jgi:two-component system chemotaxis response regulator CheB